MTTYTIKIVKRETGGTSQPQENFDTETELLSMTVQELNLNKIINAIIGGTRKRKLKTKEEK